jgi:hypothetical protein
VLATIGRGAAIAAALALIGSSSRGATIDDFATTQSVSVGAGSSYGEGGAATAAGSLGGARFVEMTRTLGTPGSDSLQIGGGVAELTSTFCCSAAVWALLYDGSLLSPFVFDPTGLGSVDLTDGGSSDRLRFIAQVNSAVGVSILVTSSDAAQSYGETFFSPSSGFVVVDVPFASFRTVAAGPADFQHLGGVAISFGFFGTYDQPLTARIGGIMSVPEPGPSGLLLLAAIRVLIARSRAPFTRRAIRGRRGLTHY